MFVYEPVVTTGLEAKCAVIACTRHAAVEQFKVLQAALHPLVGKKIHNVSGVLTQTAIAKIGKDRISNKSVIMIGEDVGPLFVSVQSYHYNYGIRQSLWFQVRGMLSFNGHAYYSDQNIYLGKVEPNSGVLLSLEENPPQYPANLMAETVLALRADLEKARVVVRELECKLSEYGEFAWKD